MNKFIEQNGLEKLSVKDIEIGLRYLPSLIARQGEIVAEKRRDLDSAKLILKVAEARATVAITKGTATDKKAKATLQTEKEALKLIEAETNYQIEVVKFEELINKFNSVRKQANIFLAEKKISDKEWL